MILKDARGNVDLRRGKKTGGVPEQSKRAS